MAAVHMTVSHQVSHSDHQNLACQVNLQRRSAPAIAGAEQFSERPPPDVPDPLGLRRSSLVVRARLTDPTPPPLDRAGLPVRVRF